MLWWRQGGALGVAGGARGVLDVDRIVRVGRRLRGRQHPGVAVAVGQRLPLRAADQDDVLERGAVRAHLGDHCGVVGGLERPCGDQHADARLVEHVLQLLGAVGRVDADQDRADLGRGVLQLRPLRAVRRPDADPVALLDAQRGSGRGRARRRRHAAARRSSAGRCRTRPAPPGGRGWQPCGRSWRRSSPPGARRRTSRGHRRVVVVVVVAFLVMVVVVMGSLRFSMGSAHAA